jgi:hypothetical protein
MFSAPHVWRIRCSPHGPVNTTVFVDIYRKAPRAYACAGVVEVFWALSPVSTSVGAPWNAEREKGERTKPPARLTKESACAVMRVPTHCANGMPGSIASRSAISQTSRWCVIRPASLNDSFVVTGKRKWNGLEITRGVPGTDREGWSDSEAARSSDELEAEAPDRWDGPAELWRPGRSSTWMVCSTIHRR